MLLAVLLGSTRPSRRSPRIGLDRGPGGVPERSNGAVLKTVGRASVPWVQIPPPPLSPPRPMASLGFGDASRDGRRRVPCPGGGAVERRRRSFGGTHSSGARRCPALRAQHQHRGDGLVLLSGARRPERRPPARGGRALLLDVRLRREGAPARQGHRDERAGLRPRRGRRPRRRRAAGDRRRRQRGHGGRLRAPRRPARVSSRGGLRRRAAEASAPKHGGSRRPISTETAGSRSS